MTDHLVDPPESLRKEGHRLLRREHTFTERRRTQQRLAQRAYRSRKENELSALQKRIDQLEGAIEESGKAILTLCDMLLESSLLRQYPHITPALHRVTENCLSLAKVGQPDPTTEDIRQKSKTNEGTTAIVSETPNGGVWWTGVFAKTIIRGNRDSKSTPLTRRKSNSSKLILPSQVDQAILPRAVTKSILSYTGTSSNPPIPTSFPSLYSTDLSHQDESPFSHRLIQTCFQRVYRLLTNPSANQDKKMKEIFGSQFTRTDRARMALCFQDALLHKVNAIQFQIHMPEALCYEWNSSYPSPSQDIIPLHPWRLPGEIHSDAKLMNARNIEEMLWEKGITSDGDGDGDDISYIGLYSQPGSSVFDARFFISYLSNFGICSGHEPLFQQYQVEEALNLAIMNP